MAETTPDTTGEVAMEGAMGNKQLEVEKIKEELTVLETEEPSPKRYLRFWLVFVALCSTTLLSAFDLVSLSSSYSKLYLIADNFSCIREVLETRHRRLYRISMAKTSPG